MLALADATGALAASIVLGLAGNGVETAFWASVFLPVWILLAKLHGLYDRDHRALRHLTVDELPTIGVWALTGTGVVAVLLLSTPVGSIDVPSALRAFVTATLVTFVARAVARFLWRWITPPERTLVAGSGPLAEATLRKLHLFRDIHVHPMHMADVRRLSALVCEPAVVPDVDRIILASDAIDEQLIARIVHLCRRAQIKLAIVPPARGLFGTAVHLEHIADLPLMTYNTWDVSRSTLLLKRALDITASAAALLILAPLFAVVAAAIRLDSAGAAFFVQQRAGCNGKPFRMRKFRTMVADAERVLPDLVEFDTLRDPMFKLKGDPRTTRVGRMLRRTSIDELPQLWNVLRGEMSLVGPRPEQVELVERYEPRHRFRLDVKPGITGPMQVFGRGELTFEERLAVEREYIENLSLGRDLRILAMTVAPVFNGRGAF